MAHEEADTAANLEPIRRLVHRQLIQASKLGEDILAKLWWGQPAEALWIAGGKRGLGQLLIAIHERLKLLESPAFDFDGPKAVLDQMVDEQWLESVELENLINQHLEIK